MVDWKFRRNPKWVAEKRIFMWLLVSQLCHDCTYSRPLTYNEAHKQRGTRTHDSHYCERQN